MISLQVEVWLFLFLFDDLCRLLAWYRFVPRIASGAGCFTENGKKKRQNFQKSAQVESLWVLRCISFVAIRFSCSRLFLHWTFLELVSCPRQLTVKAVAGETLESKAGGLQLIQAIAGLGPQAGEQFIRQMEVWWGVFFGGCSCVWWGFPAPFEAQLAFCTVAWQTWKVYGSEGAIQLCIASCNCPALPSHAEKLMDFPWLRNALQEESEVVHKQVSYRKQVVYFLSTSNFLKQLNSLQDQGWDAILFSKKLSKFRRCYT